MATSLSRREAGARGFTMIEVLFSILVLSVGMVSLASLAAQNLNGTAESRYMGLASTFASEKLEDLNRWPTLDPNIYVATGTVGSLTADTSGSVTSDGVTETVNYYDDVEISDSSGAVSETVSVTSSNLCPSNGAGYVTTQHLPSGLISQTCSTTKNTSDTGAIAFHRRWTIEANQPTTGVKRVTVLVTLSNGYLQPPVSFQMSLVRS